MSTARRVFLLPDLGEGLTESEIVSWRVAVGDTVTLNQIIGEVETAKAIVEIPAPYAGTIARLHAEPGSTVNVGEPLVDFEVPDAAGSSQYNAGGTGSSASYSAAESTRTVNTNDAATELLTTVPTTEPNLVGYGAPAESAEDKMRRARRRLPTESIMVVPGAVAAAGAGVAAGVAAPMAHAEGERVRSVPPVRKMAHDLGIDIDQLEGTGENGIVTREDVEAAFAVRFATGVLPTTGATRTTAEAGTGTTPPQTAPRPTPAPATAAAPGDSRETRTPIHGVRKAMANAMVQSAFTAPHVTCFLTVDVTRSVELLDEIKADAAQGEPRIGILALTALAVCLAAKRTPELNSHWDDAAQEIVQYHYMNLGIAAATPRGLLVPVIRDAQALNLAGLASAIAALSETARTGATTPAAMQGATFSISNIGVFGVDAGTPIINPGEAGILALGAVRREPREWHGEIALRDVVTLSLSFDHRLVDGQQGSRFVSDVGAILTNPARVLTMLSSL